MKLIPGVIFHRDLHLMVFRQGGIANSERLDEIIQLLEREEDRAERPFNRFTDTSKLDAIDLEFRTVFRFSLHRRLSYARYAPVKSAIYVASEAVVRIAKIHVVLTDHSPLQVRMFRDFEPVAKWLEVPIETLTRDPDAPPRSK